MLVRIYWQTRSSTLYRRQVAMVMMASLLALSAVLAFTVTLWVLALDMRSQSAKPWLAYAVIAFLATQLLSRYIDKSQA